jgi:adenylate cyclase
MIACPRCQTLLQVPAGPARCPTCGAVVHPPSVSTQPHAAQPPPMPMPMGMPQPHGLGVSSLGTVPGVPQQPMAIMPGMTPGTVAAAAAAAAARLVLRGAGGNVVEFPIGGVTVIGRSTGATIQLADREVSRRHTQIAPQDGEYVLSDMGSSNGTFLNGRRLYQPTTLKDSDEVMVGTTRLVFRRGEKKQTVVRSAEERAPVVASVESERVFANVEDVKDVAQLRRDYERLRIAHEFQRFIRIERDLHALLAKILEIAFELIPAENGVILLRDERTNELVVEAVRQRKPDGSKVLISETLLGHVANKKQGVLTSDALDDERFNSSHSIVGLGVRSCMAVPLLSNEEVRGVMFIDSRERIGAFTTKDLDVLSAIASQATIALENSELARKIEESAAKRSFLERFLSPQLASQVEKGKIELTKGGQLQELTVLFSDIRGFTTMSEHSPPQETVSMLNEYFELMADCVFAYDGIVDKFIGDAVMALFGAPIKGPDDAERAVRCAMLMQQKTVEFNEARKAVGRAPISVGIGLHTGEAVVGVIGSTKRLEYTAVGDTVNVASRLCSAAGADEIVLSAMCLQRAGASHFPAEQLPPLQVKGRAAQLNVFRIGLQPR